VGKSGVPDQRRAAGALDRNTVEARRVLYARARIAQAGELRKLNPPLAEQEIALGARRLALEDAIRKLEAESRRERAVAFLMRCNIRRAQSSFHEPECSPTTTS
jgi:hypothetical protein